jgi:2-polyprenyl-3-methyl-5-hydroxy-6-metoxy-1,4-benzoquinol methylase
MHRNCIICHSDGSSLIYRNNLADLDGLDLSYTISSCSVCGAVYASELATENEINTYYKRYSKYDIYESVESVPVIYNEISKLTLAIIKDAGIVPAKVFDIGSSFGTFLNDVRNEFDCEVKGIDPAPNARTNARKIYDVEVETGFYTGNKYLSQYDLVSANSVLEHIIDVHKFVSDISSYSRDGSYLVLTVPSADDFINTKGEWLGEFSNEHINFFSKKSLDDLLKQYQYVNVSSDRKKMSNGQYPLVSIFRKDERHTVKEGFSGFDDTTNSLQSYIGQSEEVLKRIYSLMNSVDEKGYVLWGAGSHTQKLLCLDYFKKKPPVAIIDSNEVFKGVALKGIKVFHPNEVVDLNKYKSILVSSYNAQNPISNALISKGYKGNIIKIY